MSKLAILMTLDHYYDLSHNYKIVFYFFNRVIFLTSTCRHHPRFCSYCKAFPLIVVKTKLTNKVSKVLKNHQLVLIVISLTLCRLTVNNWAGAKVLTEQVYIQSCTREDQFYCGNLLKHIPHLREEEVSQTITLMHLILLRVSFIFF